MALNIDQISVWFFHRMQVADVIVQKPIVDGALPFSKNQY